MKTSPVCLTIVLSLNSLVHGVRAEAPSLLDHRGRVSVNGVAFDGIGQFKFALVNGDGAVIWWANSPGAADEPSEELRLPVVAGAYSVRLGDPAIANMTALPTRVFTGSGVRLRVWFNDGTQGWHQLTPDQPIATSVQADVSAPPEATPLKAAAGAPLTPPPSPQTPDTWQLGASEPIAGLAPSARYGQTAVWTGSEMIIWSGQSTAGYLNTGARYNPAANTWTPTSIVNAPSARNGHTAVWSGSEMIIWGGIDAIGGPHYAATGGRYDPVSDTWRSTSVCQSPSGRVYHTAVWANQIGKMIVWGGVDPIDRFDTGGLYDPMSDTWQSTATTGAPQAREQHSAVWTGTEMIIWGGLAGPGGGPPVSLNTGARYNPILGTWTDLPTLDAPSPRIDATAVWTGTEMLVWGGASGSTVLGDGGRLTAAGVWQSIPVSPVISARSGNSAVWTGSRMIVWGGGDGLSAVNTGAIFDPGTGSWSPTTLNRAPPARSGAPAIWTGTEMIVWGGFANSAVLNTGGRYDPAADRWLATPATSSPAGRSLHTAVWTGSEMLVWGGDDGVASLGSGYHYNPAANSWTFMETLNAPSPRYAHTAIWDDSGMRMIVWGGLASIGVPLNSGGMYNPANRSWTPTKSIGAPTARSDHSAVWTDTKMVVWGGFGSAGYVNTGGIYDPSADSWQDTATGGTVGPPGARGNHTAVWARERGQMIVWGGKNSGPLGDGGRFDPVNNVWLMPAMPIGSPAPSARFGHTAVWTASRMIIWGGQADLSTYFNTGAQYDPQNNSWAATDAVGARVPSARAFHTAIWTGREMILWGGESGTTIGYLNTGAEYDPTSDQWGPTLGSPPSARSTHTAVWTGSEMIIWGGYNAGPRLNDGGRYDPTAGLWRPIYFEAPGRSQHTAIWTGSEMIVWGGIQGPDLLNTGGRYDPVLDYWTATPLLGAPSPRFQHSTVWTGTEMIIWGGLGPYSSLLNTGGRFNPAANTWLDTPTAGAPTPRRSHAAVWTGKEMLIWGGFDELSGYPNSIASYSPGSGWTIDSPANPPSGRERFTAVWTGREMIVWGGFDGVANVNTGGRYNPVTKSWTPTDTTTAPTQRRFHTAVWTGKEMIVWGGAGAGNASLNTGARYDPNVNMWTPTSLGASPRRLHTAIWTGSKMIFWGGWDGTTYFDTGGVYDPVMNNWFATSLVNAPSARISHTAVWTCRDMIVFGGSDPNGAALDSLRKYRPDDSPGIPGLFNTGVDSSGTPLPDNAVDPHYRWFPLGNCIDCPYPSYVATSAGGFPIPPWLDYPNPISAWIGPSQNTYGSTRSDCTPNFFYLTQFDLTGMDPTTALITGRWATDNQGTDILINGVSTGQANAAQSTAWTPFQIRSGFVAGVNTLEFLVHNDPDIAIPPDSPTGLRVEMTGTICPRQPRSPPMIVTITMSSSGATIMWYSLPGYSYRVQYGPDPGMGPWTDLAGDVVANSYYSSKLDPMPVTSGRFYRVVLLP